MYFKLIYSEKRLYHARLYNAAGEILFWTKESATKQPIIDICDQVRRQMNAAVPIYDV
ncbi:MAG TPA: hypothetical protein VMU32_09395 [Solirubrobacteraceae bacterium]|nr:hypothetical protein [Solirubrobacteraceae bacterium]